MCKLYARATDFPTDPREALSLYQEKRSLIISILECLHTRRAILYPESTTEKPGQKDERSKG